MIPKIIHYCWLSNDPVPEMLQKCMQTWKKKLPDYEFMLWNFDRFDKESSLWVKQAFEAKKYATAADYIRLYAVYHHGGIYLDMDVTVLKSFDDLLNQPSFIGFERDRVMEAAVFGAEKHSKWVAKAMDYYSDKDFYEEYAKKRILMPEILSEILHSAYDIPEDIGQIIKFDDLTLYPYEYFMHKKPKLTPKLTSNTYTLHMWANSWFTPRQKIIHEIRYTFTYLGVYEQVQRFYRKTIGLFSKKNQ